MTMIPQVLLIALWGMSVGIHAAKHGEPRQDKYNAVVVLVVVAIEGGLLYWGGFFDVFFSK